MKNFLEDNQEQHNMLGLAENQKAISDNLGKVVLALEHTVARFEQLEARVNELEK